MSSVLIEKIRDSTPLSLRRRFGPSIAYCVYFWRVYMTENREAPKVLSLKETIAVIKKMELSALRFGDGEISLMENQELGFQSKNKELAEKLRKIIQTNEQGLLICIPGIWGKLDDFSTQSFKFILHHLFRYGYVWRNMLSHSQTYGDAYITRPYLGYKNKLRSDSIFRELFSIWEDKKVVLIEGEKSRLGVGNDMFSKVSSIQRILCPTNNAYDKYTEIKKTALNLPKDTLILLSLGPTAKVLTYDLFKEGYRVIDIGHIDMEYEMFLRKESKIVKVDYKYFNEIGERNPEDCKDKEYLKQIISKLV
jgi:glycosyltransferase family protein